MGTHALVKRSPLSRTASVLLQSIAGLIAIPALAAPITWNVPLPVANETDVSTLGSLDRAYVMAAATVTLNGVPFAAWAGGGDATSMAGQFNGFGGGGAPFTDLSANYQTLLTNGFYSDAQTHSVTLNNVAPGLDYEVQYWVNDSRACCSGRQVSISGSAALAFSSLPGGVGGVGSYVKGTFTADATSQTLVVQPVGANPSAQINGLQLRATGVSAGKTATISAPKNFATLTTGAGSTVNFNFATDQWQSTVVSGAGSLHKSGAGTLILTSAQTYSGSTSISGGILRLGTPSGPTAGASMWLDASNAATLQTTAGAITQWNDAAGGTNFLTPGGGTPTLLQNALNGRPVVDLGAYGSGSWMLFNQNMANIQTAFWITKAKGFMLGSTSTYEFHRGPTGNGTNYSDALWESGNGWSSPNIRNGQTYLNGGQIDGTVKGLTAEYNLVSMVTNGGGVQANALANDRGLPGRQGGQQIGEIILFNTPLGSLDRVQTEAYLAAKWFAQGGATNNVLPTSTAVTISGGGRLDLAGNNQTIGSLAATDASSTSVSLDAGRLTVSGANNTTFDGVIAGAGGLTRAGTGTLILAGVNTYAGTTEVIGGKLLVTGSLAVDSVVTVAGGATLGGTGSIFGPTTVQSGGTIEQTDGPIFLNGLTLNAGTTLRLSPSTGGTLNVAAVNGLSATGGAGSVAVRITGLAPAVGNHVLIDYAGALGGGLAAFTLVGLPNRVTATLTQDNVAETVRLNVTQSDFPIWTGGAGGAWATTSQANPKNWSLNSNNTTGTDYQAGDNVVFTDLATNTAVTINGADVSPSTVSFNSTKNYTVSGTNGISGSTGINKSGSGSLTLNTPNSFGGPVRVLAGTLRVGHPNALGSTNDPTIIASGATLDLNGTAVAAEPLTLSGSGVGGAGVIVNSSATAASFAGDLTVIAPATFGGTGEVMLSGVIASTSALTKVGTGRLVLAGNNSFGGQFLVNEGAVRVTHNSGLGVGGFSGVSNSVIANGAALELANDVTINEHFHFAGAGIGGTGGVRSVSGINALTTAFAIDANSTIGVDAGILNVNAEIYHDGGPFSVTKAGAGTLALNAANTFAGGLNVFAGIVKTGHGSALATGQVIVGDGASIDLNGQTILSNNISIIGSGVDPALGALGNTAPGIYLNALQNLTLHGNASIGGIGRWDIGRADFTADPNDSVPHIFGNGNALTKVGPGYIGILGGMQNVTALVINGGILAPHDQAALSSGPIVINSGGTLQPWGGLNVSNPVTLNGGTLQTDGFVDNYGGGIEVGANGANFNPNTAEMRVTSVITGTGPISKTGNSTLWLTAPNTATGNVSVSGGRLRLGSLTGPAILGNLNLTAGNFTITDAPNQFGPATTLNFAAATGFGELVLMGNNQTVAGVSSVNASAVIQNSHQQIGSAAANAILTINQNVDSSYIGYIRNNTGNDATTLGITKGGTGKLTLSGGNLTYTGPTTVNGGTLAVNGSLTSSAFTINVGGTLSGTGPLGPVTANAGSTVAPGNSTGILATNNLILAGGSLLAIEINGVNVGTDYDQLSVAGTVDITGATLTLSGTYVSPLAGGDLFTILLNDGTLDPVVGTFAGLPEGKPITALNGQQFTISYAGGDGNDIVLTSVPEPGSAMLLLGGIAVLARRRRR